MSILGKIFGDANKRYIKSLEPIVDKINELEKEFEKLSDEELRAKTDYLKKLVVESGSLDVALAEAFAAVREASKRTLGQRHFDVQLIGGIVLHQGKIAEMRTGEGKTLVATLPAYLNALTGKGVHIVTVNDYLAQRDTVWMGQVYHLLGLSVGCINHDGSYLYDPLHSEKIHEPDDANSKSQIPNHKYITNSNAQNSKEEKLDKKRDITGSFHVVHEFLRPVEKKEAYDADITYGTNNEYGFDYLRDNMAYDASQMTQMRSENPKSEILNFKAKVPVEELPRESPPKQILNSKPEILNQESKVHNFAIVDEVDSILIDEARTPLIISAPDADSTKLYETFSRIVPRLTENADYNVDEKLKAVTITESGIEKVEKTLGLSNIYDEGGVRYVHHMEQALKANVLFKRDRDYVVRDGEIIIVDEFTGRLMPGRRWSEGLHQAVEAKEGVGVQKESRTLATITFQNYFRLYKKLAGMTGTAQTSAEEFHKVYDLDVVSAPTNKPAIRWDLPDKIYKTETGKFRAVAREAKERHEKGQPVLIGTVSIEKNELLSKMLEREGVKHNILNAKNHEKEAEIIAQAGRFGAVTVATNMAGRGVDIMLGGIAPNKLKINEKDFYLEEETKEYEEWERERQKVVELGGLHVIGTERHEARRIDDQLRGRSGRQGDPGSSQFFVSTEDDVARIFGGDRMKSIMDTLGIGEDDVIENRFISRAIEQAQSKIEGHNFDIRKYVLEYDDVMNKHREAVYRLRREALFTGSVKEAIMGYVLDIVNRIVALHASEEVEAASWNVEEIGEAIGAIMGKSESLHSDLIEIAKNRNYRNFLDFVASYAVKQYEAKEKEVGLEFMSKLEKLVLLRTIDELWMDHIEAMEQLRDSVRLRAYGQRDPLIEYKIEGQKMFEHLQDSIKGQVASLIFKVSFIQGPREVKMEERRPDVSGDRGHKYQENTNEPVHRNTEHGDIGRNDPCPCGSGKKYKKCGMINAPHHGKG